MTEELFAAEKPEAWMLHSPLAQLLVRQVKGELQNLQARHRTGRQRRLAALRSIDINRSANIFRMRPVHSPRQLHQSVLHIDNPIEP